MSEVLREPVTSSELIVGGVVQDPRRYLDQRRSTARNLSRTLTVVHEEAIEAAAAVDAQTERERYVLELELRLRELVEIERMRDLEIHRLEADVEAQSARITELETALFHAERRGDDLDRRWNELAEVYEETAGALICAGAQLESIHRQTSYRLILSVGRAVRRRPALYDAFQRVTGRLVKSGDE